MVQFNNTVLTPVSWTAGFRNLENLVTWHWR